ncbi:unnamed protein product [Closterium sp. Naga37s-1]|nr:unnamed protein product [Closterium sp. Naga37s-1]
MDTEMGIFNSTFRENIAYGHLYGTLSQGGVINQQWTMRDVVIPLVMEECAFERNVADFGAVGYFEGHVTVRRSRHERNEAQFRYGGAYYATMSTTIEDSLFAHNTVLQDGGAIATAGLMGTVVRGCVFRNNTAISGEGGAIFVLDGTEGAVEVEGSRFEGNTAPASKGGAISAASARLTLAHTTFHCNRALVKGGAVAVSHPTSPPTDSNTTTTGSNAPSPLPTAHFSNVTFGGNSATLGGAALHLGMAARAALVGCRMEGGQASNGGGVMLEEFAQLQMARSECTGNRAPSGGGCISMSELASVYQNSSLPILFPLSLLFSSCSAPSAIRGRVHLSMSELASVNNAPSGGGCIHDAPSGGGCISMSELASVTITSSNVTSNQGGNKGGAIQATGQTRLVIVDSHFFNNSAMDGGMLWAEMDSVQPSVPANPLAFLRFTPWHPHHLGRRPLLHSARALHLWLPYSHPPPLPLRSSRAHARMYPPHQVHISSSVIARNTATIQGGVLYLIQNARLSPNSPPTPSRTPTPPILPRPPHQVHISSSVIARNTATIQGGALYLIQNARLSLLASSLRANTAARGGAILAEGGVRLLVSVGVHISSSVIARNTATIQGGALYLIQNARLTLLASSLRANTAARGGAILAEGGVRLLVAGGTVGGSGSKTPGGAAVFEGNSQHAVVLQGQAVGSF